MQARIAETLQEIKAKPERVALYVETGVLSGRPDALTLRSGGRCATVESAQSRPTHYEVAARTKFGDRYVGNVPHNRQWGVFHLRKDGGE